MLFPGQGSERKGMGARLAARCKRARSLIDQVSTRCDLDAHRLLTHGGADWQRTEVLQPLLVAVSLGFFGALEQLGLRPRAVAGHSLGELTAWAAAGCVSSSDAIDLAATRGQLMAREAEQHPGGLLALTDHDEAEMRSAIAHGQAHGQVGLAGRNGPQQWVLSGQAAALRAVAARFRGRPLPALGPWHSAAMTAAAEPFRRALQMTAQSPANCPYVAGGSGAVMGDGQIPDALAAQLTNPFRWDRALTTLRQLGIRNFITVGPAKVLRALIRANLGTEVTVTAIETTQDLDRLATRLQS